MVTTIIPDNEYDTQILMLWRTVNAWGWGKFIPLGEFFELFNLPESDKVLERMKNNFIYYRTNYLALYTCLLLIVAFSNPVFAVIDFCIALLWLIPFIAAPKPFVIMEYRITPSFIVICTALFTLLTIWVNKSVVYFLGLNLLFTLLMFLHLVFRNSSIKSKVKVGLSEKIKQKFMD